MGQRVGHGEPLFALCKQNVEIMRQLSLPRASHHCRSYKRRGQKVRCHCMLSWHMGGVGRERLAALDVSVGEENMHCSCTKLFRKHYSVIVLT